MGRYYIDKKLWSTDIYILDVIPRSQYKRFKTTGIEISDRELKKLIIEEEAKGKKVNLWWKPRTRKARISNFQKDIENNRYNQIMNSDK
ncbi:MAG: hypothetical protein HFJ35_04235 [Clostridia bacterium]|nr:hypothetical protein [Clostridia bacterium]